MKKPYWFFNDTYFANVYFFPGRTSEDVQAFIQRQFGFHYEKQMSGDGRCIEVENDSGSWGLIIQTRHQDFSPASLAALAHECLHATNNILRRVGVRIEIGENDEAQTYLLGWMIAKCIEKMR